MKGRGRMKRMESNGWEMKGSEWKRGACDSCLIV